MRHPFDGLNAPETTTRRSWLRGLFAALAGLFAARAVQAAAPPPAKKYVNPEPTTTALREEGAKRPATRAVGEEGKMATLALNEAGAGKPKAKPKPRPKPGNVTTLAIGEE
jgi:hypothetical protein